MKNLNLQNLVIFYFLLKQQHANADPFYNQIRMTINTASNTDNIYKMMGQGRMAGYFTKNEFWGIQDMLRVAYPRYISEKFTIGYTHEKRPIEAFKMGLDMQEDDNSVPNKDKSMILFTGLHHAREPLSQSMMVNILGQTLYNIVRNHEDAHALFSGLTLLFVPIVNQDTYTLITKKYDEARDKGQSWADWKMLRKNRHKYSNCNGLDLGVDLNRNYSYKFAYDDIGSSDIACQEDYRGPKPFSEPETKAIKKLVESLEPKIVSAMNFHCYGNLWIHPFNYIQDKSNKPLKSLEPFSEIYEYLHKHLTFPKKGVVGNAKSLIDYVANGEASDWMLGEKGIIAWSPELGNSNKRTDDFYISPKVHEGAIRSDFKTIEGFINKHIQHLEWFDLQQTPHVTNGYQYWLNRKLSMENEDTIHYWTFFHKGLANHNDLTLDFYLNDEFNKAFNDLSYVVMTSDKLSLKDKPDIHNADQATIQKYRKEKLNSMYETINYQKLSHEVIKNGFRLTGIKIPRWSYIIFKIRLKYRVDHSFVTIYEIKDQKQIQKYSGYYSPKKMYIADNSPLSIIIYILW